MAIKVYRRHREGCPCARGCVCLTNAGAKRRGGICLCGGGKRACGMMMEWMDGGQRRRVSAKTRSWEDAVREKTRREQEHEDAFNTSRLEPFQCELNTRLIINIYSVEFTYRRQVLPYGCSEKLQT